jgi:hypothetical protein
MADNHAPEPPKAGRGRAPEPERAPTPATEPTTPLFNPDERVFLVGPDGSRVVVQGKDVGRHFRMGFRLESPEEGKRSAMQAQENTVGGQLLAGAEGAASSLTLGGSDLALHFLDPEGAQARADQFSGTRMLGGIIGAGLSMKAPFLPGGLAIRAGEGVGAKIAGTGVVKGLVGAGGVRGVAGRALPAIGQGVVENAMFGAGEGLSQTALSDKPINAEALIGNMSTGAFLGGGVGGAFGLGGSLVGDSIDLGRKYFAKGAKKLAGEVPSADLVRAGQRQAAVPGSVRAEARKGLRTAKEEQAGLINAGREAQAAAATEQGAAAESLNWFRGDYDTLDRYSGSMLRRIEKAGDDATPEMQFAYQALKEARDQSREFLEQRGLFRRSTGMDEGLDLIAEKRGRRINEWMGGDEQLARGLQEQGFSDMIARQEDALTQAKSLMDGPPEGAAPSVPKFDELEDGAFYRIPAKELEARGLHELPGAGRDTVRMERARARVGKPEEHGQPIDLSMAEDGRLFINDGRHRLRAALEKGGLEPIEVRISRAAPSTLDNTVPLGKMAAGKTWAPFKVARDVFQKTSNFDDVMLRATGGVEDPALAAVAAKIDSLEQILATGTPASRSTMVFAKEGVEAAQRAGNDVSWPSVLKAAEESGMDAAALGALSPEAKVLFTAQYAREAAKRTLAARGGKGAPATFGQRVGRSMLGTAAGWAVGGHVGAVLAGMVGGGLLGRMLKGTSIGMARRMATGVADTSRRLAGGIDNFLATTAKRARSPGMGRTAVQILKGSFFGDAEQTNSKAKGSPLQKLYQERAAEMVKTVSAPMDTKRKINEALIGVRITDPAMADQLGELIMRRIGYMYDTMPKAPYAKNPFSKVGWVPSDAEVAKWTRCIEIAEDPTAIFTHMENGTLTVDHVHALQEVYPQIYDEIHMDIISQAAQLKATLPWEKRVTLSTLFDAPTDDILRGENVFFLQETFVDTEESTEPPPPRPPSTSTHSQPTKAQQLSG